MNTTLKILNSTGDREIGWDHTNPEECAWARQEVADLKNKGYLFFLMDGTPADEVAAGNGKLIVRQVTAEEVMSPPEAPTSEPAEQPKKRGRPPKNADKTIIATPILRGG